MAAKTRTRMRSRMKRLVYICNRWLPLGRSTDVDIRVMVENQTKTLPSASKANEKRRLLPYASRSDFPKG